MPRKLQLLRTTGKLLAGLAVAYLFVGLCYSGIGLYCYNVRNWNLYGGFSLPPLFFPFGILTPLLWPLYLWADWVNSVGVFGDCLSSLCP
ncbi:MAG: hypothetical protein ACUVWR_03025 [Anaerolineae bacterium]